MLTKQESTDNFVDQEMTIHLRPIKIIYNKELTNFIVKFLTIKEDIITDESKLKA